MGGPLPPSWRGRPRGGDRHALTLALAVAVLALTLMAVPPAAAQTRYDQDFAPNIEIQPVFKEVTWTGSGQGPIKINYTSFRTSWTPGRGSDAGDFTRVWWITCGPVRSRQIVIGDILSLTNETTANVTIGQGSYMDPDTLDVDMLDNVVETQNGKAAYVCEVSLDLWWLTFINVVAIELYAPKNYQGVSNINI